MPELRTDDGPRRLRAVWLGPKGLRFGFDWTYVQWGVFLILGIVLSTLLVLLLLSVDPWLAVLAGPMWGWAFAWKLTPVVMKNVDYDRPLRWHRHQLTSEWKNSAPYADPHQQEQLLAPVPHDFAPRVEAELFPHGRGPVTPVARDWKETN